MPKPSSETQEVKIVPDLSAAQIVKILEASHDPKQWAFFDELRIGTGYGKDAEQRFDAWAIHYFPSKRNVTRCYEIKISRSDFQSEMKKPLKRRPGLRLANEFFFVTPQHLLKPEEIPPECGLIEIDAKGAMKTVVNAPFRDVMPPTWLFMSAVCRRLDQARYFAHIAQIKAEMAERLANGSTNLALQRHIRKWREHNIGSREVPDQILAAMEDLKREIDEIVKIQTNRIEV